ncbi:phosphotransferase [Streptomyces sp. SBT349]|uniref:phosphotransferase n=1 Tax=Streptomyces sp. SBT349 TaxID=1580539 RepID=UPI00069CF0AB|nr:phosphotransferase [Streptomyces sp. SBT349]
MGRTVSAWVTRAGEGLGTVGPFPVDIPWWSETEPVVERVGEALGVPVLVLRLLRVEGGEGARNGHVTYHVEALERPDPAPPTAGHPPPAGLAALLRPEPLRASWATADGLAQALDWAARTLAAAGRPPTGPAVQRRTWNLSGLFRLPTARGPVWLKATPRFAADEAAVIAAFARADPGLVPALVGAGERRVLLEHLPGEDHWGAAEEVATGVLRRLVAAQAALPALLAPGGGAADAGAADGEGPPPGLRDGRGAVLAGRIRALLDGPLAHELTAEERAAAHALAARWPLLDACGLPDTVVHGDFHPGNWRGERGGPPVVVDFADASYGNPVLDGLRARDFLPEAARGAAARAWIDAWKEHAPGSDPARALAVAEPLAHLGYALRYQEFLDGIEPTERIYHRGDPAAAVRAALRAASDGLGTG